MVVFLSRRYRRLAAPGRYKEPRPKPMILNLVEDRRFELRPLPCKSRALPTELIPRNIGWQGRGRTFDILVNSQAFCR